MCGVRINTLVVDFSVLPARPEPGKVQSFLENELKLQYADVKSIQLHNSRNCVYIEMKSRDIVSRYQMEHNWKRTMVCADKSFRIPVYVDCEAVTVRLHDLPPAMSNATIAESMLKFGELISIRKETWKHYFSGIPNGVRVLRMNLLRDIPSFITIDEEITMVSYLNQPKLCRHCDQPAHPGNKCLQSSTQRSTNTPSEASNQSGDGLFSQADFPPITTEHQNTPSPIQPTVEERKQQNSDGDGTDGEDNASSSTASEFDEVTHKRRRSTKKVDNDNKKVCSEDQCSPSGSNTGHEEIVGKSSPSRNKNVKGFNCSRYCRY